MTTDGLLLKRGKVHFLFDRTKGSKNNGIYKVTTIDGVPTAFKATHIATGNYGNTLEFMERKISNATYYYSSSSFARRGKYGGKPVTRSALLGRCGWQSLEPLKPVEPRSKVKKVFRFYYYGGNPAERVSSSERQARRKFIADFRIAFGRSPEIYRTSCKGIK